MPSKKTDSGRGPGQPPFEPTADQRKQVRAMVAYGVPLSDIAPVIGVSRPTLSKHFAREIETAAAEANAKVGQSLYQQAVEKGNVTAQIFWLKTKAGWRESSHVDLTSSDRSMTPSGIDPSKLSDAALEELMNARDADQ